MKKTLTLILAFAFAFALTACNNKPEPEPTPDPEPVEEEFDEELYKDYTPIGDILRIGPVHIIEQPEETFLRGLWPDSRIIPMKKGDKWQMFWAEAFDVLTTADTPWPEDHIGQVRQENAVFGQGFSKIENFNEYGSWFIAMFQHGAPGHYIGFIHGESHWSNDWAYKSIGVTYSDDYGQTWYGTAPILVDDLPKGPEPSHAGLGDGSVIWDEAGQRFICYYQTQIDGGAVKLAMAMSKDPEGRSGTWKKWDGEDFTVEGYNAETHLGGPDVGISKLGSYPGANPSIIWSRYLKKWVMAYHSWSKYIYISFSEDCVTWTLPKKIAGTPELWTWYPSLICKDGDKECGRVVRMYYSYDQQENGQRQIAWQEIVFN